MGGRKKQKRERISESFLVDDLVDDLLIRLPTKSLLRFKCVSCAWYTLISSFDFGKKHLIAINSASNTSNDGQRIILSSRSSVQSINFRACTVGEAGLEKSAITLEFPAKHPQSQDVAPEFEDAGSCNVGSEFEDAGSCSGLPICSQDVAPEFEVVGSCNGLLCLVTVEEFVILWNPCIGEYKTLAQPPHIQILRNRYGFGILLDWYGFGYDPSCDDYKVLRIVSRHDPVDILSLKTDTWKRTQNLRYRLDSNKPKGGTLVDGVLYWIGVQSIVGFDVTDEKFELVELPNHGMNVIHFGGFQGRLCLVSPELPGIVLWVLTKDDKKQKWTQLMRISSQRLSKLGYPGGQLLNYPIFFARNGQVLAFQTEYADTHIAFWICSPSIKIIKLKGKGKRICMEREYRRQVTEVNSPPKFWLSCFQLMPYIETLVSPHFM